MTASSRDGAGFSTALFERLDVLMALPPEDCAAELGRLAETDPNLAHRLERLISRAPQAESWLLDFEQTLARGLASELDSAWAPGRVIGPYRLERLLATGGMDAVFLARKADGELKRPVALKLVPPGLVNDETLGRFRQERDLLASLVHPNIAALLDAGISDEGQPWFAMEYIEGERFDVWSLRDANGRKACVRKMRELAGAVAFAHRNLVVHGDLKPGNVMIDSTGRLRLLDFGISRMMNENQRNQTPLYYTARYAAPEVRSGSRAGTASDVYSLGVMIEELIQSRDWGRGAAGRDLAEIAVCARADHPDARYENARQLADDLGRWLRGEPVMARAGGIGYRLGRRARRHPFATLASVLAISALIAFGTVSHIQAERFARERDKARELARFLEQVFVSADPETEPGTMLTARELLDRGRRRLAVDTTEPSVRAEFLSILGRTYQRLGEYETAGRLLDQALAVNSAPPGERIALLIERAETHRLAGEFDAAAAVFGNVLDQGDVLGAARHARALGGLGRTLAQAGRPSEAVPLLEESLERTRGLPDADPGVLADRLNDTGSALFRLGRLDQAVERLEEALALRRELDREAGKSAGSPRTATLVNNLGLMHYLQGRPGEAEPLLRDALEMRRKILPVGHPDVAQTLTNLGLLLKDYGSAEAAVGFLREALEVRRAGLQPDHYRIGQAMLNLAIALRESGEPNNAENLFQQSLERLTQQLGTDHPQVAVVHTEMGTLWLATGRADRAEAAFRRSLDIRRKKLPELHPHLAWSLVGLGTALTDLERHDEALPHLREAVAIRQAALPENDPLRVQAEDALRKAQRVVVRVDDPRP